MYLVQIKLVNMICAQFCYEKFPSQMDVEPWCYKWGGLDWLDHRVR